jgi:hypothetical protein
MKGRQANGQIRGKDTGQNKRVTGKTANHRQTGARISKKIERLKKSTENWTFLSD